MLCNYLINPRINYIVLSDSEIEIKYRIWKVQIFILTVDDDFMKNKFLVTFPNSQTRGNWPSTEVYCTLNLRSNVYDNKPTPCSKKSLH